MQNRRFKFNFAEKKKEKTKAILFLALFFLIIWGANKLFFSDKNVLVINNKKNTAEENKEKFRLSSQDQERINSENPEIEENVPEKSIEKNDKSERDQKTVKIISKIVDFGYEKPSGERLIDTIIIHTSYNAMGGEKYDLNKLIREYEEYGVSAHYLINREGSIYQLVEDKDIAYHAGESKLPDGRTRVNKFSLGIELTNSKEDEITKQQYLSLKMLLSDIKKKYKIKYVLGHKNIAPGRKDDPWNFDWNKLK